MQTFFGLKEIRTMVMDCDKMLTMCNMYVMRIHELEKCFHSEGMR